MVRPKAPTRAVAWSHRRGFADFQSFGWRPVYKLIRHVYNGFKTKRRKLCTTILNWCSVNPRMCTNTHWSPATVNSSHFCSVYFTMHQSSGDFKARLLIFNEQRRSRGKQNFKMQKDRPRWQGEDSRLPQRWVKTINNQLAERIFHINNQKSEN